MVKFIKKWEIKFVRMPWGVMYANNTHINPTPEVAQEIARLMELAPDLLDILREIVDETFCREPDDTKENGRCGECWWCRAATMLFDFALNGIEAGEMVD